MGTPKRRRSDRAGRPPMRSPGRPTAGVGSTGSGSGKRSPADCRAKMRRWRPAYPRRSERDGSAKLAACRRSAWPHCRGAICRLPSEKRSQSCMPSTLGSATSLRRISRSPSTISRELRRNAATRSGGLEYRATTAQWHADRRAQATEGREARCQRRAAPIRAGPARRHDRGPDGTSGAWSRRALDRPPPRAPTRPTLGERRGARSRSRNRLRVDFPDDESMRISHEAIYQALYVQGRGALRRELVACLRTGRALRVPRARTRGRGKEFVSPEIMISERPAEAAGSRRARTLGRRPDPRARQLRDRDARRAHHPVHDAAAPASHGWPR